MGIRTPAHRGTASVPAVRCLGILGRVDMRLDPLVTAPYIKARRPLTGPPFRARPVRQHEAGTFPASRANGERGSLTISGRSQLGSTIYRACLVEKDEFQAPFSPSHSSQPNEGERSVFVPVGSARRSVAQAKKHPHHSHFAGGVWWGLTAALSRRRSAANTLDRQTQAADRDVAHWTSMRPPERSHGSA